MTTIGSSSTPSQTNQIDRRSETSNARSAQVSTDKNAAPATATPTPAAAPVAEAQVRTPADAATVEANRLKAAGHEDGAKARVLAQNDAPASAGANPRRGLQKPEQQPGSCVDTGNFTGNPADLLEQVRGKGRGSAGGIADDGSTCAPPLRDPNTPITA